MVLYEDFPQLTFTCSKPTMKTPEKCVKFIQIHYKENQNNIDGSFCKNIENVVVVCSYRINWQFLPKNFEISGYHEYV